MKRFIIAIDEEESGSTVKKMMSRLNSIGSFGWWHYTKGTWLVIDGSGTVTVQKIRDGLMAEFPGVTLMVFEIPPGGTWAGFGPTGMEEWIVNQWDK